MLSKSILEMNKRERKHNSFAGKTVRNIISLSLAISIAAGLFAFYLYWCSIDYIYRANTAKDARIIAQSLDLNELRKEAEKVSGMYDSMTEEELKDDHNALSGKIEQVQSPAYKIQLDELYKQKQASEDRELYIAFLDTEHRRMVYVIDTDTSEKNCPPGYWDECNQDEIESYTEGKVHHWFDRLYGSERLTATTYVMEEYGFRSCGAEKLFDVGKYPVCVFCEQNMNKAINTSILFMIQYTLLVTVITVIVLILSIRSTKKKTVEPINKLAASALAYTKDSKENHRDTPHFAQLDIRTGDELEALSIAMKNMESDLAEYVKNLTKITAEKERVNTELALAKRIQADMLPNIFPAFPDRKEFNIFASMTPAKEVGGDFYDFFFVDKDHLAIVMADVSGKGIPAAMFMMMAKSMIQSRMITGTSPSQVLEDVNNVICVNNHEKMFVTVWLGVLDVKTGVLTASNAGHENPIIKMPGEDFKVINDEHGFVIGGFEGMKYTDYNIKMEPGARLFVYTDGVPEATNADEKLFGMERTVEALNSCKDGNPTDILTAVDKHITDFVGKAEQFDDLTMLCIEYYGIE